jgi:hypothetical protein
MGGWGSMRKVAEPWRVLRRRWSFVRQGLEDSMPHQCRHILLPFLPLLPSAFLHVLTFSLTMFLPLLLPPFNYPQVRLEHEVAWILPLISFEPARRCPRAEWASCLSGFAIQGAMDSRRRNYTLIWQQVGRSATPLCGTRVTEISKQCDSQWAINSGEGGLVEKVRSLVSSLFSTLFKAVTEASTLLPPSHPLIPLL